MNQDQPLRFHESIEDLITVLNYTITSTLWLKSSIKDAKSFFKDWSYIANLESSVTKRYNKIDKSILNSIEEDGFNKPTPLFSKSLIKLYQTLTIASKDILWEEKDFQNLLKKQELQFIKHLRNASAHKNKFYFGKGKEREKILKKLPVIWRNKEISEKIEGEDLYFSFMAPGDLPILLSDISNLTFDNGTAGA